MINLETFKRKCRRFRYLHFSKFKSAILVGKILISAIITICTLLTTIITVCIAKQTLDISKQALEVSQIALKSSALNSEPIFDIDVDWENDKISVKHETYDVYKIKRVLYGKIRTIAIMNEDSSKISSVELHEEDDAIYLERGNNVEMSCSEEEVKEYNKKFELSLGGNWSLRSTDWLNKLQKKVEKKCEEKNFNYWGASQYFHYYYIEIVYSDVYGNTKSQYYIYKNEYRSSWRIYKLSIEQYKKYTKDILYNYTYDFSEINMENHNIIKKIFSDKNFKKFEKTKYYGYDEWFALDQFE